MSESPIILALDTGDLSKSLQLIEETIDVVGIYKLGLEFFVARGIDGIKEIRKSFPEISLFLDLKLHDIPNTVAGAAAGLSALKIDILTVHAAGGEKMIESAARALPDTRIAAVTLLTSIDSSQLEQLGFEMEPGDLVLRWATMAVAAGARAIVASPLEVSLLRQHLPREVKLITPGIRFDGSKDDQARTMSPKEAMQAGSDYLVIGRPITKAPSPKLAAAKIYEEILGAV